MAGRSRATAGVTDVAYAATRVRGVSPAIHLNASSSRASSSAFRRSRSTASSASSQPRSMSSDCHSRLASVSLCFASQPSMSCPCPIFACSAASACERASKSASNLLSRCHASLAARCRSCSCCTVTASVSCADCLFARSALSCANCSSTTAIGVDIGAASTASSDSSFSRRDASCAILRAILSRRVSATRMSWSICAIFCCRSSCAFAATATASSSGGSAARASSSATAARSRSAIACARVLSAADCSSASVTR